MYQKLYSIEKNLIQKTRCSIHFSYTRLAENILSVVLLSDIKPVCDYGMTTKHIFQSNRFYKTQERTLYKGVIPWNLSRIPFSPLFSSFKDTKAPSIQSFGKRDPFQHFVTRYSMVNIFTFYFQQFNKVVI